MNKLFFLRFAPKNKRVAWMPSFGGKKLADYNIKTFKKFIGDYEYLSAREKSGAKIIKELTGRDVPVLSDPVFLIDNCEWRNISQKIDIDNYILAFFLDKPSSIAIKMLKKMSVYLQTKIIAFSYDYECWDNIDGVEFAAGGPEMFLALIDKAKFVMTDSFHASAFSVIFETPFYVFDRNIKKPETQSARVTELLSKFNMENRRILSLREISQDDFFMDKDVIKNNIRDGQEKNAQFVDAILGRRKI